MTEAEDPLAALRAEIDALDEDLAMLLASRAALLDRVIAVKRANALPARIPERVEEVIDNARRRAEARGLDPDLAEAVWRVIVEWSIAYEEGRLDGS